MNKKSAIAMLLVFTMLLAFSACTFVNNEEPKNDPTPVVDPDDTPAGGQVTDPPTDAPTDAPTQAPTEPPKPAAVTGTVKVNDYLCIRSGAGTSNAVVGYYAGGTKITILEQKTSGSGTWGRTDKGWISMGYVQLDAPAQQPTKVIRTVTADCLLVRKGAGTGHVIVGYLYRGAQVEILEQTTVAGQTWGRTSSGWICLAYTK